MTVNNYYKISWKMKAMPHKIVIVKLTYLLLDDYVGNGEVAFGKYKGFSASMSEDDIITEYGSEKTFKKNFPECWIQI